METETETDTETVTVTEIGRLGVEAGVTLTTVAVGIVAGHGPRKQA